MIELKNSKTQYLGKASGRERYTLDAFIGAVQMREPGATWQDIKPRLVRDADGWHIEGAPYYAEVKDDGTRLFCPDRNEKSKYLRLPAPALFSGLSKDIRDAPTKLDNTVLPNTVVLPTDWGEYRVLFSNTGMHFEVWFREAPPSAVFGKDSPRILLDVETAGLDIEQLLKSTAGAGIPRPRLIANEPLGLESQIKRLGWNYKGGQLELGMDLSGLEFPVLLKNTTIDDQVDAGGNDGYRAFGTYGFHNDSTNGYCGYGDDPGGGLHVVHCFQRFEGITLEGTIDVAYLQTYGRTSNAGTPELKVHGVDEDNPAAPTNATEFDADPITTAGVDWDGLWTDDDWNNSPSLVSVVQELVDSYTIDNDAIMFQIRNDHAESGMHWNNARSYDSDPTKSVKLHIEFSTGGATAKTSAETGAGAEGSSLKSAVSRADTAGGVDTRQSLMASLVKADTAGGVDTRQSLLANLTQNESGAGVEQSLLESLAAKLSADTGSGSEAAALMAGLAAIESGLGVDVGWLVGLKSILSEDGGVAADALKALVGTSSVGSEMKLPGRQGQVKIPSKGVSL